MKMKQNVEENKENSSLMSKELEKLFGELLNFEAEKLSYIYSTKLYMDYNGLTDNYKFLREIYKRCESTIHCLIHYLTSKMCKVPEIVFPAMNYTIKTEEDVFEQLTAFEDKYEELIENMLDLANEDKDWKSVSYLMHKLDEIDHVCCKAFAAVKNHKNPYLLIKCEQPLKEN